LLSLIQVRKQRVEFMLKFFCCAHAGSIAQRALCVSVIFLRALSSSTVLPPSRFIRGGKAIAACNDSNKVGAGT